jgi:hypothetical protein
MEWRRLQGVALLLRVRATTARNSSSVAGLFVRANMDPQIRRWLIALAIAIVLFAIGMTMSMLHLI